MENSPLLCWHFHITGLVQGIGFRPHVYRIAKELNINGWVSNDSDGVHIEFRSTNVNADLFRSKILESAPTLAHITTNKLQKISSKTFNDFKIVQKESTTQSHIAITPDLALCEDCRNDLKGGKRKDYPFISCSQCGPRYSILQKLAFERHHTAMNTFVMCDSCLTEYGDHMDRRFYAQTMSCHSCQIPQQLFKNDNSLVSSETVDILSLIPKLWKDGKIIAIKGIGGFLLTCAAQNEVAVQELRLRKNRPSKPFALMIPNLGHYLTLKYNPQVSTSLKNHVSPITLCSKDQISHEFKFVADNLDKVGIMIPYTPLFQLLLHSFNQPIIATSGNVSNSPIIFDNKEALENLSSIADYILVNDRDIIMPQDDSVITYSQKSKQKIILRRARGMAPNYLEGYQNDTEDSILCLGAEMKSTFCISHHQNIYISQYIGNLLNFETQKHYSYILDHFLNLIQGSPTHICVDTHPEYFTHQHAAELAQRYNIPITTVQHHKAHFASILGEHKRIDSDEKILGVIWDGTGLGDDGMIWGSEFFVYENYTMSRCAHLDYYTYFLHEKMATEARICAFALLHSEETANDLIREKFNDEEWRIYKTLISKNQLLQSSSMGRLFDAASSILGIIDKQSFEEEAAMLLEVAARRYISSHAIEDIQSYEFIIDSNDCLPGRRILIQMIEDLALEKSIELIAAKFHLTLVKWIIHVAQSEGCLSLSFSGGVFQNSVLVDLIHIMCAEDFTLYFHNELSPNDENISYGQYIYFKMTQKLDEKH